MPSGNEQEMREGGGVFGIACLGQSLFLLASLYDSSGTPSTSAQRTQSAQKHLSSQMEAREVGRVEGGGSSILSTPIGERATQKKKERETKRGCSTVELRNSKLSLLSCSHYQT